MDESQYLSIYPSNAIPTHLISSHPNSIQMHAQAAPNVWLQICNRPEPTWSTCNVQDGQADLKLRGRVWIAVEKNKVNKDAIYIYIHTHHGANSHCFTTDFTIPGQPCFAMVIEGYGIFQIYLFHTDQEHTGIKNQAQSASARY